MNQQQVPAGAAASAGGGELSAGPSVAAALEQSLPAVIVEGDVSYQSP